MEQDISAYVGGRVRSLRKNRKMSIQALADQIEKSKACVSKYEKGEITIDVPTLIEIAKALNVPPGQLINYTPPAPKAPGTLEGPVSFFKAKRLYFYYCDGRFADIKDGIINVHNEKGGSVCDADFTINIVSDTGFATEIYYSGTVTYSDMLIRFSLQNQYNPLEEDLLYIFNPLERRDGTSGLLCGISSTDLLPCAFKCIVSLYPLPHNENLRARLTFTKEEVRHLKKMNMLTITNDF